MPYLHVNSVVRARLARCSREDEPKNRSNQYCTSPHRLRPFPCGLFRALRTFTDRCNIPSRQIMTLRKICLPQGQNLPLNHDYPKSWRRPSVLQKGAGNRKDRGRPRVSAAAGRAQRRGGRLRGKLRRRAAEKHRTRWAAAKRAAGRRRRATGRLEERWYTANGHLDSCRMADKTLAGSRTSRQRSCARLKRVPRGPIQPPSAAVCTGAAGTCTQRRSTTTPWAASLVQVSRFIHLRFATGSAKVIVYTVQRRILSVYGNLKIFSYAKLKPDAQFLYILAAYFVQNEHLPTCADSEVVHSRANIGRKNARFVQ